MVLKCILILASAPLMSEQDKREKEEVCEKGERVRERYCY